VAGLGAHQRQWPRLENVSSIALRPDMAARLTPMAPGVSPAIEGVTLAGRRGRSRYACEHTKAAQRAKLKWPRTMGHAGPALTKQRLDEEKVIDIMAFGSYSRTREALRHDRDTELLRSDLLSIEQLKRHAVTLARQHRIDPRPGPDRLLPRLAQNERVLLAAYDVVTATCTEAPGQRTVPAEACCSTTST
jgi:hypothetical protein